MSKPWLDDGDLTLYHGDALEVLRGLPAGIAQTCVTSPPYWGLRSYLEDGHADKHVELGLEATPQLYVTNMVNLFREVWRVLRDDGTLWLNLGDSYASSTKGDGRSVEENLASSGLNVSRDRSQSQSQRAGASLPRRIDLGDLKPKDLVGIPWQVAFALQADGWYLRSDIIWAKPNPMPESVSDRPTKAHEYLFLFSKQPRYFYDADAIREPHSRLWDESNGGNLSPEGDHKANGSYRERGGTYPEPNALGRNRRSVWTIPTQPFPEAHFATYPEELVRPCILAGTSERGECVECGAPWVRQVEREIVGDHATPNARAFNHGPNGPAAGGNHAGGAGSRTSGHYEVTTTGWAPSCSCHGLHEQYEAVAATEGAPAIMRTRYASDLPLDQHPIRAQTCIDPFIGSGTTALVARKHGRRSIGIDLSLEYLAIAAKRTSQLSLLGSEPAPLAATRGLTGGAYNPPGQSPHSNARPQPSDQGEHRETLD